MAGMIASGHFDAVLGSRILGVGALAGWNADLEVRGEPVPDGDGKSVSRVQARRVPHRVPRVLAEAPGDPAAGGEQRRLRLRQPDGWRRRSGSGSTSARFSCPARYFPEASSINFRRSVKYGLGVLGTGAGVSGPREWGCCSRSASPIPGASCPGSPAALPAGKGGVNRLVRVGRVDTPLVRALELSWMDRRSPKPKATASNPVAPAHLVLHGDGP